MSTNFGIKAHTDHGDAQFDVKRRFLLIIPSQVLERSRVLFGLDRTSKGLQSIQSNDPARYRCSEAYYSISAILVNSEACGKQTERDQVPLQ